jgi:hypothetical protein
VDDLPGLDAAQRAVVRGWFARVHLVADASGDLRSTRVLHVRTEVGDVALRASDPRDHRLGRELDAHHDVGPWLVAGGVMPRLLHADRERRVLATAWVPGSLVEGHRAEQDPDTYRQAGVLLRALHAVGSRVDGDWEAAADARALRHLDAPHRIDATSERLLRSRIGAHAHPPVRVVPTHGDFRPRHWVRDGAGRVRLIGFGRFGWRPPVTDLVHLDARRLAGRDDLAGAFAAGYGADARRAGAWQRAWVREAIGTAVRARRAGEEAAEARGLRMIEAVLSDDVPGGPA